MHFDDLHTISAIYRHVYLSPHLDDAALSCGGAIARQRMAGEPVLVVNICTAAPRPEGPFSELAREFHREWGLAPEQVVATRLREDRAALDMLGADSLAAGQLDAIYRLPEIYCARDTLFAPPAPADPLLPILRELIAGLRRRLPAAAIYAPLGVGSHVDHQITFRAALETAGAPLAFYEDLPYAIRPGALEARLTALELALTPREIVINQGLERKLAAISAYASQLAELSRSQLDQPVSDEQAAERFLAAINAYAHRLVPHGAGERLWELRIEN